MKRIFSFCIALCLLCPVCCAAGIPKTSAASAILMDADSGRILYEKDAHTPRLIASTTKLMTALVAVESTPDLELIIPIKAEYQAEGSSMYLRPGEEVTLEALLYGLLLASGNDAALAIAGGCAGDLEIFVEWMNQRAESLGMKNTHFVNPNGLDAEEHYSTAYDMALLARAVLENEILRQIVATKSITTAGRAFTNHNKLLWRYEGCCGMKTGYTDAAGRTLVSCAARDGQTLICVTLKDPNDWDDHAAMFDYGFQNFPNHLLIKSGKIFRRLTVEGSLIPQVGVVTATDMMYPLTAAELVHAVISLPVQAVAPVRKGSIAGKITLYLEEKMIGESYLLYDTDVPENMQKGTLFQRITEFLRSESTPPLSAFFRG